MVIFYVLLCAYIAAINFYAFLLIKNLKDETDGSDDYKK